MIQISIFVDGKTYTGYVDYDTAKTMVDQLPVGAIYRAIRVKDGVEIYL